MPLDTVQQSQLNRAVLSVQKINRELKKSYFCVPPYASVTNKWVDEIEYMIDNKSNKEFIKSCSDNGTTSDAKFKVTSLIIDPKRRAAQIVNKYKKLPIFLDFCEVIDHATVAFLQGNEICSRITMIPVIEGLFERWYDEINTKKFVDAKKEKTSKGSPAGIKKILSNSIDELVKLMQDNDPHPFIQIRVISCLKFLKTAINQFYSNEENEKSFNRNISLHSMKPVNYGDRLLDNCRLFLLIDIIAEAYLRINQEKYPNILSAFDYNGEDFKRYANFYSECESIKNGSIFNKLKQVFWSDEYK